jgi:hypothetical protein
MYKSSSCFDLPGLGIVNHFNVYCSIYLGYLFRISCGFDFSFLRWLEMLSFLSCTYCHLWGCFLRLSFQIFNSIIYLFIYLFIIESQLFSIWDKVHSCMFFCKYFLQVFGLPCVDLFLYSLFCSANLWKRNKYHPKLNSRIVSIEILL